MRRVSEAIRAYANSNVAVGVAIACLVAIVGLSLYPGGLPRRTTLPGAEEHFIAYVGTGILIGLLRRGLLTRGVVVACLFIVLACALEFLQSLSPGRHPQVIDAVMSASGGILGLILGRFIGDRARSGTDSDTLNK